MIEETDSVTTWRKRAATDLIRSMEVKGIVLAWEPMISKPQLIVAVDRLKGICFTSVEEG